MSQTDENVEELPLDEEEQEEEEEEEEQWSLYNTESFISVPFQSEKCTLPEDVLKFHFSFGYDCRKYFNLTTPDPDTVLFISGNFIHFLDVSSRAISFRRSALGGGIAHIKANPNAEFNHVAVAENGIVPLIIIYEWPTMEIICVLKGGSQHLYSHLDYSPDGLLLVSQGGEPDYLITIWNWPKRRILLRTKSYVNDVYRVKFSPYVPGQLTSCGISHIKFWKMANTFTGLKLKGELGRFGKTEFSDILGVLPMPDEKVVSGCAWGNILVWDAGLIKLEVFRTLRRKCHDGPIIQIAYNDGELMTIAMDGHVKVWWYEKIDQADPPDDDRIIQIEPTYDFYTPGLMLMCLRKRYPDPTDHSYFGQDGNGGIWLIDLNPEVQKESVQLYKCHAGKVVAIASCPWGPYLVSLGEDGRLYLYAYLEKKRIFEYEYPAKGSCLLWFDTKISPCGDELVMGFDDGTIRLSILIITEDKIDLKVTQNIKAHDKKITKITVNPTNQILVSGAEDCTVFLFQIVSFENTIELIPIGFIPVPNIVTYFTWSSQETDVLLIGCLHGEIVQIKALKFPQPYTTVSYLLEMKRKDNQFTTYKAQIRRNIKLREIEEKKAKKVAKKRVEMEKMKKENPGLDIDEEIFLADSESEEELEPLFIPEIPNRILWMQSTQENTIWLSMGGYDAGYIYEYKIDQKSEVPYFFKMIHDGDDIEISSFIYNYNKKYLIFAMQNGEIRVNRLQDCDYHELSDYWSLAMHDNQNGFVPNMCFSFDEKFFFSCGHDGNVFSYTFHPENDDFIPEEQYPSVSIRQEIPEAIEDEANYEKLSLEQASLKKEQDRIDCLAAHNRELLREKLFKLRERYVKLLKRNDKLVASQVIPIGELEVDSRVTEYLDEKLDEEMALVKRKLAFEVQKSEVKMLKLKKYFIDGLVYIPIIVTGLKVDAGVRMLRQNRVAKENEEILAIVDEKIAEAELRGRHPERPPPPPKVVVQKKKKDSGLEYFLVNLSPSALCNQKHMKLGRLLTKYRGRKIKWERREEEWEAFLAKKPQPGINHPDDDQALSAATITIGDFKLKSDKDYKPAGQQDTTIRKYKELLVARVKQFQIRYEYNKKVYDLRDKKLKITRKIEELSERLKKIHEELPNNERKVIPTVCESRATEFPERDFEITLQLTMDQENQKAKHKKPFIKPPEDLEKEVLPKLTKKYDGKKPDFCSVNFDELCIYSRREKKDTLWEYDIRRRRHAAKLYEQTEIIHKIEEQITDFDNELQALSSERFDVEVKAKLMDLFMVTLQQELVILKEFESLEYTLQAKVNHKLSEVLDMRDVISSIGDETVNINKEIEKEQEHMKTLQSNFVQAVHDNKFFDFLRKVFRKKYKPPKIRKEGESSSDESSSSSSSSSESEDEGKSIDSRDFGIIKQDINVCPKGCDPAIYEYTVNLRTERHHVEIRIKDYLKQIEVLKKDLEIQTKKVKINEKDLKMCQDELEKYQKEKQLKLNEVRCTIILHLNQLQHLTSDYKTSNILDTLVFSKTRLSQLYGRVDCLQKDTAKNEDKHELNLKHFTRMKTDCEFMRKKIRKLQESITDKMKMKFGKVVDLNEIEEAMLKRSFGKDGLKDLEEVLLKKIVHDLRLSMMDIKGMYTDDLLFWKHQIKTTQKQLTYALQYNTAQQELLTSLVKEKTELAQVLMRQEKKKLHLVGVEDIQIRYNQENAKLEEIVHDQVKQMGELKDEIKVLRTKGMVLKPKEEKKEMEREKETKVWEAIDTYTNAVEEDDERKPFSTEIVIPTILEEKSREVASEMINEMLDALEVQLSQKSTHNLVQTILHSIMKGVSITDLIEELLCNLPIEPDEQQTSIIETTAEQLYVVGETELIEIEDFCSKEIMEDIVDEVLLLKDDPETIVLKLMTKLVDQLPIDFLRQTSSIDYIIGRLLETNLDFALNRADLIHAMHCKEAEEILDTIVQKVFDSGLDLLYYIKD